MKSLNYYDKNGDLKKNIYSFPPIGTADSGAYTTVEDLDIFIRRINTCDVYKKMLLHQTDIKVQKEDYLYTMGIAFEIRELVDWKYEGVIYRKTQDPYVKKILDNGKGNMMNTHLFAPDVIEIDGKYYMYYGVGLSKSGFGVAVSDSPIGPFQHMGRIRYPDSEKPKGWKDGKDGINDGDLAFGYGKSVLGSIGHYPYDPGVIYDNGRLFMYYGLAYCRVVELDVGDKRTVIRNEKTGKFESEVLVPGGIFNLTDKGKLKNSDGMAMVNAPSIRLTMNPQSNGYIEFYADEPKTGEYLGKLDIKSIKDGWQDYSVKIKQLNGIHSIYFVFHSEGKTLGDLSYFSFS